MLTLEQDWTVREPEALVNGATLRGLASTSLLEEAKTLNPDCGTAFDRAVRRGELVRGLVFPVGTGAEAPRLILLVVTRVDHLAVPTRADLVLAVENLRAFLLRELLRTVAVGAFAEGRPKEEVLRVLQEALGDLETEVVVKARG